MTKIFKDKILVVDDDSDNIELLTLILEEANYEIISAQNGKKALEKIKSAFFNVILLDIRMPEMDGIETLKRINKESPQTLVILLTAYGTPENIEKAISTNVYDIIEKPVDNKILLLKIRQAFQHFETLLKSEQLEKEILKKYPYENIIGTSPKMRQVFSIIEKVAPTDTCVLITGESGTGKELVARAIHFRSKRSVNPFVVVDAGALPETLLESELFGHEKGAFTDARQQKIGYFESCQSGTIFLDEIGDISPKMQFSLLRVLQEKIITRVGNTRPIKIDTRIITATNSNLENLIEQQQFRKDLFYRIKTVAIHLPPLRERRSDISLLIDFYIHKNTNKKITITDESLNLLLNYEYPGNIRELEHIIEHALIFQEDSIIRPANLPPEVTGTTSGSDLHKILSLPWKEAKAEFEKRYIESILDRYGGNISEASRNTGYDRAFLQKRIKMYGIKNKAFST